MRKPRDFDAELRQLDERAKALRQRRTIQLGELVAATGADTLPIEVLVGALLGAAEVKDAATRETWRARGAVFFQRPRHAGGITRRDAHGVSARDGGAASPAGDDRAQ